MPDLRVDLVERLPDDVPDVGLLGLLLLLHAFGVALSPVIHGWRRRGLLVRREAQRARDLVQGGLGDRLGAFRDLDVDPGNLGVRGRDGVVDLVELRLLLGALRLQLGHLLAVVDAVLHGTLDGLLKRRDLQVERRDAPLSRRLLGHIAGQLALGFGFLQVEFFDLQETVPLAFRNAVGHGVQDRREDRDALLRQAHLGVIGLGLQPRDELFEVGHRAGRDLDVLAAENGGQFRLLHHRGVVLGRRRRCPRRDPRSIKFNSHNWCSFLP